MKPWACAKLQPKLTVDSIPHFVKVVYPMLSRLPKLRRDLARQGA